MNVPVTVSVPEPNTWHEVLSATEGRPERRIALQLYGRPHPELVAALEARGAEVTPVAAYSWELPEDLEPLREAVTRLASEAFEVVLFTTSNQIVNLMKIAGDMDLTEPVLEGLRKAVVGSIGPGTTEMLADYGVKADLEPSHPKLGLLVKETAEQSAEILWQRKAV
jgi:uroporphyrinogen-III synthase